MTTIAEMSMGELAAYVCKRLEEAGITNRSFGWKLCLHL